MIIKDFNYTELPIGFSKKAHRYSLDKLPMIGVTTVIRMKAKEYLRKWVLDEMFKSIDAEWDLDKTYTAVEKQEILLRGYEANKRKSGKALDSGTIAHDMIDESIVTGKRIDSGMIENEEVRNSYQAFLDWEKTHDIEYYASELIVGSRKHWTAGTVDAVAMVDGKLEVLDWKTSKQLSDDVFLQTGAYKMMLREGGVGEIGRRAVRFDKFGGGFQDYPIPSDYLKDVHAFLGLLEAYRWDRDVKVFKTKWGGLKK